MARISSNNSIARGGCGGHDPKSCSCDPAAVIAHAEALAGKREANRQAARRLYEKAKQNQHASHNETNVENTEELEGEEQPLPEGFRFGVKTTVDQVLSLQPPETSAPFGFPEERLQHQQASEPS
jgi:hypothetical protein